MVEMQEGKTVHDQLKNKANLKLLGCSFPTLLTQQPFSKGRSDLFLTAVPTCFGYMGPEDKLQSCICPSAFWALLEVKAKHSVSL